MRLLTLKRFKEQNKVRPKFISPLFRKLSDVDASFLESSFTMDEVKNCDVMRQMGFGYKWLAWIKSCLSSASISILVNGSPSKEFKMEKGLRQGDSLSHFLFLLIVEAFQISIFEACNKGLYKYIFLAEGNDNLSLLQYANDALFFGKWSRSKANTLILILKCFEEASSLKVNLAKSRIFRVMVGMKEVETVSMSLGCLHDSILFMYLRLPVRRRMNLCDR
ncbi:reverse transcriptase domain, reverse transcriptase zinc-binding domain protein [Tanacetum coccineum]